MLTLEADNTPMPARSRVEMPCAQCGVMLSRRPSELAKSSSRGNVFCSQEHYFLWNAGKPRTRARAQAICQHCEVSFDRQRSQNRGSGTYCSTRCAAAARGINNAPLPIGTRRPRVDGYVQIKTATGWRPEHRVRMEEQLRRPLRDSENVHHLNGRRNDNRIENLELWVKSQPAGQRVTELVDWAQEVLALYADEASREARRLRNET